MKQSIQNGIVWLLGIALMSPLFGWSQGLITGTVSDENGKFSFAGTAPFRANRGVYFYSFWSMNEYASYIANLTDPMPSFEYIKIN